MKSRGSTPAPASGSGWTCRSKGLNIRERTGEAQPGVHDVVSVADVQDLHVVYSAQMLSHRHYVGENLPKRRRQGCERGSCVRLRCMHPPAARPRLAGVVVVCEPVDDGGMGRVLSQIKNVLVREQAGHDDIVIPIQAARNVPAAA